MAKKLTVGIIIDPHLTERSHRCRKDNFLDTALAKLEYVAERCDKVIICGDLFHIYYNSTAFTYKVAAFFMKWHGKFECICGNHDVFGRNQELSKTSLGTLYCANVIEVHTKPWTLNGVEFVPMVVTDDPATFPVDKDNKKILIAHKFYEQPFSPSESLSKADIKRLNYYLAFLGHDHKPYEELAVGNTTLIRMGSLTRIDVQRYNRDREICYYELTIEDDWIDYKRRVIPTLPIQEVYTDAALRRMELHHEEKEKPVISFTQIGDAIAKLTKKDGGNVSLDKVLRRIKTPAKSIVDIKARHEINHIEYT